MSELINKIFLPIHECFEIMNYKDFNTKKFIKFCKIIKDNYDDDNKAIDFAYAVSETYQTAPYRMAEVLYLQLKEKYISDGYMTLYDMFRSVFLIVMDIVEKTELKNKIRKRCVEEVTTTYLNCSYNNFDFEDFKLWAENLEIKDRRNGLIMICDISNNLIGEFTKDGGQKNIREEEMLRILKDYDMIEENDIVLMNLEKIGAHFVEDAEKDEHDGRDEYANYIGNRITKLCDSLHKRIYDYAMEYAYNNEYISDLYLN